MSQNAPLLTDTSRLAAIINAQNFAAGVAAHINGDWSQHVQVQIINKNWLDSGGNFIPGSKRLRISAVLNGVTYAVVLPILPFHAPTSGSAPIITTQPTNQTVVHGSTAVFAVVASGPPVITYRWRFKGIAVNGATSSQFVISNAQSINTGAYDCVVSNSYGFVITNSVQLFVT